jgi:hypothetical protein
VGAAGEHATQAANAPACNITAVENSLDYVVDEQSREIKQKTSDYFSFLWFSFIFSIQMGAFSGVSNLEFHSSLAAVFKKTCTFKGLGMTGGKREYMVL